MCTSPTYEEGRGGRQKGRCGVDIMLFLAKMAGHVV
jgi:hypothetical protein